MTETTPIGALRTSDDLPEHLLLLDSQEIEAALEHVPAGRTDALDGVTGVLSRVIDPDTLEIWGTGSARPFDRAAAYIRLI